MKFKSQNTFESRLQESSKMMIRYPNKIPIICEKINEKNNDIPLLDKTKYLVPMDMSISQFLFIIRNRLKLSPEKAIFLLVENMIPQNSSMVINLYEQFKDPDGFLYITYSGENVFG
jgi:GABA(A) receptor-associated protein